MEYLRRKLQRCQPSTKWRRRPHESFAVRVWQCDGSHARRAVPLSGSLGGLSEWRFAECERTAIHKLAFRELRSTDSTEATAPRTKNPHLPGRSIGGKYCRVRLRREHRGWPTVTGKLLHRHVHQGKRGRRLEWQSGFDGEPF